MLYFDSDSLRLYHSSNQDNAWCDTDVAVAYAKSFLRQTDGTRPKLLLLDNLRGHTANETVDELRKRGCTEPYFGPSGCTDKWQPIDAGLAKSMKDSIYNSYDDWLLQRLKLADGEGEDSVTAQDN